MKRTASPSNSPGSSFARLTTSANALRNQAPDTQEIYRPIPTLSAYEPLPLRDWDDVSDSSDDAELMDHSDLRLHQRSREQLRQEHGHEFSKQSQTNKILKVGDEELKKFSYEKREDLIAWIKVTHELVDLNIDASLLDMDQCNTLIKAIIANTSLKTLFLQEEENNIDDNQIKILLESFKTNTSLKKLTLHMGELKTDGMKALGEVLKVNTTLEKFGLYLYFFREDRLKVLAEALKVNTSLKKLTLGFNYMNADGFKALAEALKVSTSLKKLEIYADHTDVCLFKALAEVLKVNTSLNALNYDADEIDTDGLNILIEALKINTALTDLKLPNFDANGVVYDANGFDADGLKILKEALKINTTLTDLKLLKNEIDDSGSYSSETDSSSDSTAELEEKYPVQPEHAEQLRGLVHRNKLRPLTHPAGVGLSTLINSQYPELINLFPEEVGHLITQYMLSMSTTNDNPMAKFQNIEKNLFELAYGAKVTGVSPTSTS